MAPEPPVMGPENGICHKQVDSLHQAASPRLPRTASDTVADQPDRSLIRMP